MKKQNTGNIQWHQNKVTYQDRCTNLKQDGIVLWLTGLSGSGKSTIATELEKTLTEHGKSCYILDGDNIRHGLNADLSFSKEDRMENIRRIAEVAGLFRDAGLITIVSFISPYKAGREEAKTIIGKQYFKKIYIKADLKICQQRDPKGLYKKALSGEIKNFTGISDVYEKPEQADLIIDTSKNTLEDSVKLICEKFKFRDTNELY